MWQTIALYAVLLLCVLSAVVSAVLLIHQPAMANGGVMVVQERVGEYEINVEVPSNQVIEESNYHLSVMVLDAETKLLAQETTAHVTALPPSKQSNTGSIGPIPFPPITQGAYRHLAISIPQAGKWTIRIDLDGPLGSARTEYILKVARAGIPWGLVAVTGASIFLLFALGWAVFGRGSRTTRNSVDRKGRFG